MAMRGSTLQVRESGEGLGATTTTRVCENSFATGESCKGIFGSGPVRLSRLVRGLVAEAAMRLRARQLRGLALPEPAVESIVDFIWLEARREPRGLELYSQ